MTTKELKRDLLDDDDENLAVRYFLSLYGGNCNVSVEEMKNHLVNCGFDGCWPEWVKDEEGHLAKSGAQDWLRHLFSLEDQGL